MRQRAGLTQAQVAAGWTHRPIVARLERGTNEPLLRVVIAYAEACGGSAFEVLDEIDRYLGLAKGKAPPGVDGALPGV